MLTRQHSFRISSLLAAKLHIIIPLPGQVAAVVKKDRDFEAILLQAMYSQLKCREKLAQSKSGLVGGALQQPSTDDFDESSFACLSEPEKAEVFLLAAQTRMAEFMKFLGGNTVIGMIKDSS